MNDSDKTDWRWSSSNDPESVNGINNTTFRHAHLERLEAIHDELHQIRMLLERASTRPHSEEENRESS